eukprot:TRINITY_DN1074_c0_g2_i4.p1 TRINITY_DN1074_c0_g2~~TRINITY_DN1074_c0_g2_i4.p1  ORF type:complete len:579 (-),score=105.55 TRINITY_DN1074_c0_g2_i4:2430-4166(-)
MEGGESFHTIPQAANTTMMMGQSTAATSVSTPALISSSNPSHTPSSGPTPILIPSTSQAHAQGHGSTPTSGSVSGSSSAQLASPTPQASTPSASSSSSVAQGDSIRNAPSHLRFSHKSYLPNPPLPSAKYPHSEVIIRAEALIATDPFNTDGWQALLADAQGRDMEYARTVYERFLYQFPTSAKCWIQYIEHELRLRNNPQAESLFRRCLLSIPSVDLMKFYVDYTKSKQTNDVRFRDEVIKAYNFALQNVGFDPASGPIWIEYIAYLITLSMSSKHEENRQQDRIKQAFKDAVSTPLNNIEDIWKEVEKYEMRMNKNTAREILQERSRPFSVAKTVLRERKSKFDQIDKNLLARPLTCESRDYQQYGLWQSLIAYEKGNPLALDSNGLRNRVTFFYSQMLLHFYHYPEIWIEAAKYQASNQCYKEAAKLFDEGVKAVPDSLLLRLSYAEFEEQRKNEKEATSVYEGAVKDVPSTLVYIQYMRYARRVGNENEARRIFLRGKKLPDCTYHLYIAAANIELYVNRRADLAKTIFEAGMKVFSKEPAYIDAYISFYTNLNEDLGWYMVIDDQNIPNFIVW